MIKASASKALYARIVKTSRQNGNAVHLCRKKLLRLDSAVEAVMREIRLEKHGPAEVFAVREVAPAEPTAGQLRIRAKAVGINFADILARQGIYPACPPLPCTLGYEVSGLVDAVGEGVDSDWLGRRVMALSDFSSYAEQVCVDQRYVWQIPEGLATELSWAQAAAIPLNYLTAWGLLRAMGSLHSHETVLIHNAGGGVGLAAVDIAKSLGARVIGTASASKHTRLLERGVDHAVDYRQAGWVDAVADLTQPHGVDLVLDPIGGANWKLSRSLLSATGRMGMYGISSASAPGVFGKLKVLQLFLGAPMFHPAHLIPSNQGAFGINIHAMYERADLFNLWMEQILAGLVAGWVRPCVDKTFSFNEVALAHCWIEQRKNFGKVVLLPDTLL